MVVCLVLPGSPHYLNVAIGERTTVERVNDFVAALPGVDRVVAVATTQPDWVPERWGLRKVEQVTERAVCEALAELTDSADTEILLAQLDQPFLNRELSTAMIERHRSHWADYTFADGYPQGLAPELVTGRVVSHLQSLATDAPFARSGLFPVVARDINRIDVETLLAAEDHRMLRLSLSVDTRANLLVCQSLADGAPEAIDEWEAHAERTRVHHRSRPRFVSVQVLEQEVQALRYSPYTGMRDDVTAPGAVMEAERFAKLVEELSRFSPEAVLHISLWGELSLHPEAVALVKTVLATPALSLLVETSGVGWGDERAGELLGIADDRFSLIVGLDACNPELYGSIRGAGFEEATAFAERAIDALGSRAHVQAVRSELTEGGLEEFYKHWKQRTENVVIQKYDHFCRRLPQIRVGDLTPLNRFPCWHLQRDLHVLVDGRVPLCREDISTQVLLGNVFTDGLEKTWAAGAGHYADHVAGTFSGICQECDEYYTFSF